MIERLNVPKKLKRFDTSILQTGSPQGTYKAGHIHPEYPQYAYMSWVSKKNKGKGGERWLLKEVVESTIKDYKAKNRAGKLERQKKNESREFPRLNQAEYQTGNPKGTYKKGRQHPKHKHLVFVCWDYRSNTEKWNYGVKAEQQRIVRNKAVSEKRFANLEECLKKEAKIREKTRDRKNELNRLRHQRLKDDPEYIAMLARHKKNHAPKRKIRQKKWKQRPEVRKRNNELRQAKLASDPNFRVRVTVSKRVYMAIKHISGKKAASSTEMLGCNIPTARAHIESLWQDGMSWENYGSPKGNYFGGWHLDHIKPCDAFDLTDPKQQYECFHYTNLQPLWALDNLEKHAKYEQSICLYRQ